MKTFALLGLTALLGFFSSSAFADEPTPNYQCSKWADTNTYYLYCGGAYINQYTGALACVNGRKAICGTAAGDFQCSKWADTNTYYLYCGGAYIGQYEGALACIKGKRAICD